MVYNVIGLMSGSSLDGLDIVFVALEETAGKWRYEVKQAACIPFSFEMAQDLKNAANKTVPEFLNLDTQFGQFIGTKINQFIVQHGLEHQVHFIASHGHTVYHNPKLRTTAQIGDGATIAAITGLPVISDLRAIDIALGGQGAPIVPIGDLLLFAEYDYWLNLGGIANLSIREGEKIIAFDVCPANQILNSLAEKMGAAYDHKGLWASKGNLLTDVLHQLNQQSYYQQAPPKSLSNEIALSLVYPILMESEHDVFDMLHTIVHHIAVQIGQAIKKNGKSNDGLPKKMLVTGGGAHNDFLIQKIQEYCKTFNIHLHVPDEKTIDYKEAIVMALIGALRWREEISVLQRVTGASRDSIGGALWMGGN